MNAKKYNNIKLAFGIGKGIATFILLLLFVALGYSSSLVNFLNNFLSNNYLLLIFFVFTIGIASSILFFPVSYYVDFYLEHKFELSNQTFWSWIWEDFKGALVGIVIGVPVLLVFYFVLQTFGDLWWLPFGIIMFLLSVVLAKIVPVVILPLFYKVSSLDDEDLKSRILHLASEVGMKVENVFQFDMSKNTKKANAAFTGLGKSKRILLGDTLLGNFSKDEIETVIAHELGHYKYKHIIKNIAISTIFSFVTFFLLAILYKVSLPWFGFSSITQIAALPLLILWGMIIGLIQTPISAAISRKYEYEADDYAVKSTGKKEAFLQTLEKLTDQNLGDKDPHPLVEWFFYSHPSIKKRSGYIESIKVS